MAMGMSMKAKFVVATKIVAADGSGDFDDIEKAINDLPSSGGKIYIKEGTYYLTSEILITKSNLTIEGSGPSSIINLSNQNIDGFHLQDVNNIFIRNLQFTNGASAAHFIRLDHVNWVNIQSCFFNDSSVIAIKVRNTIQNDLSDYIFIQKNKFVSKLGIDSDPYNTSSYFNKYFWISDNLVNVGSYFVYTNCTHYFIVSSNTISSSNSYIFYGEDGSSYNLISSNSGYRIYLEGDSNYNRISDNFVSDSIYLYNNGTAPNYNIISGNICDLITDQGTNTVSANLNNVF